MKNPYLIGGTFSTLLIVSWLIVMWQVLVGGSPYHPGLGMTFDVQGRPAAIFKAGDWMYVRRRVCIDKNILADQSPSLYDIARRSYISLPTTTVLSLKGCSERSSAMQIPSELPVGKYEYRNVARYQNNLVGRDEATGFPPISIEVIQ